MIRRAPRPLRLLAATLALAVTATACGNGNGPGEAQDGTTDTTRPVPTGPDTAAAHVRLNLASLLGEHTVLAARMNSAISGQRSEEAAAARMALDATSTALTKFMEAVFGAEPGAAFAALWERKNEAIAAHAQGQSAAASANLAGVARDFGAFIHEELSIVPAATATGLMEGHVARLMAVLDAFAARNFAVAYGALREAHRQTDAVAEPLSAAVATVMPDKVRGDPESPEVDLLVNLDVTLREHAFLMGSATGALTGARPDEHAAASAALTANSEALTALMESLYGAEIGEAFTPLWERHIDLFTDYANTRLAGDNPAGDRAMEQLLAWAREFGTFLNSGSPDLAEDSAAQLASTHVFTVKDVINAQAAGNHDRAYVALREAAAHLQNMANQWTEVLVAQFADRF